MQNEDVTLAPAGRPNRAHEMRVSRLWTGRLLVMADFIVLSSGEARGGQHGVLGAVSSAKPWWCWVKHRASPPRMSTSTRTPAPRRWSDQPQHTSATLLPRLTISYVLYPGLPQNKS